ncbi:hypothetical protein JCM8097_001132 [Rhodosporidiobolus ruineniae]
MADVYPASGPQTIVPSVLSGPPPSSRPLTPSRSSSSSGGSHHAHSSSSAAFDPSQYLLQSDYPPLPPMPSEYSTGTSPDLPSTSSAGGPAPFAGANAAPARMTRAASAASSKGGAGGVGGMGAMPLAGGVAGPSGGFVSFDPDRGSGSDVEYDSEDDEGGAGGRQVEGRPRKRKSTRDLRSQAAQQAPKVEDGEGKDADDKARRKINIEYIEEKSKRHITFSKRKAGIMKKAYELSTLTGTQVLLLVVSESGWVYTFTTDKFKPLVKEDEHGQLSQGQKLIAACLEAKDGMPNLAAAVAGPVHASSTGNFEANSAIHGGQISLKTGTRAPRPTAGNRRVSSKGRGHVPTPVYTGPGQIPLDPNLPCPPGSGGIPPLPQLPTPLSANYLDSNGPMASPRGMPGQRSVPVSPVRPQYSMQQQQQGLPIPPAHLGQAGEYVDITQRTDMLHLHNYDQQYDLYSTVPPTSMSGSHLSYPAHDHNGPPPHPHHHAHQHSQPPTPHRTLHHQASHASLSDAYASSDPYALPNPPSGGNYTHSRDPSSVSVSVVVNDPRSQAGGGWQTPQHSGGGSSHHSTPAHHPHAMYAQQQQQQVGVGGEEYGR